MNSADLTGFKSWFANYVVSYYTKDPVHDHPVRLKQEHTERVCQEIVTLGEALRISPQDMLLAETMALFHDVGRFEQYASYGTFKDAVSENHAGLGLRVLAQYRVLAPCSEEERRLITKSIAFHNMRTLPVDEDERLLFFARLLRDADKLDIWRVFVDYYDQEKKALNSTITWDLPDTQACSPKILDALTVGKMADLRDMVSLADFKLLQISWVFDLNFQPTVKAVRERQYVERIARGLPRSEEINRVVGGVQAFLKAYESNGSLH